MRRRVARQMRADINHEARSDKARQGSGGDRKTGGTTPRFLLAKPYSPVTSWSDYNHLENNAAAPSVRYNGSQSSVIVATRLKGSAAVRCRRISSRVAPVKLWYCSSGSGTAGSTASADEAANNAGAPSRATAAKKMTNNLRGGIAVFQASPAQVGKAFRPIVPGTALTAHPPVAPGHPAPAKGRAKSAARRSHPLRLYRGSRRRRRRIR